MSTLDAVYAMRRDVHLLTTQLDQAIRAVQDNIGQANEYNAEQFYAAVCQRLIQAQTALTDAIVTSGKLASITDLQTVMDHPPTA